MRPLRLGTRGSQLALWQARAVAVLLERHGHAVELAVIRTSGDRLQEQSLAEVGGKGLFVKEIEEALARKDIDLAVHSAKDMPAVLPEWAAIGAVLPREDRKAQRPGLVMAAIYRALLEEIRSDGFQVLKQRTALTPVRKLWIAWRTWVAA